MHCALCLPQRNLHKKLEFKNFSHIIVADKEKYDYIQRFIMEKLKSEVCGYMKDMFIQKSMIKRTVISFVSIIIMGFGISLFSVSGFGVDPFTSMNMNIAGTLGIGFGTYQMIVNAVILLYIILIAHRGLVGLGTVFNMIGCGYACEFFQGLIKPVIDNNYTMAVRIPILLIGIVVLCLLTVFHSKCRCRSLRRSRLYAEPRNQASA